MRLRRLKNVGYWKISQLLIAYCGKHNFVFCAAEGLFEI